MRAHPPHTLATLDPASGPLLLLHAVLWHVRVEAFLVEVVSEAGAGEAVFRAASTWFSAERGGGGGGSGGGSHKRRRSEHCTERLPLMLQHQGHSRLIVGVLASPARLLIRDPSDSNARTVHVIEPRTLNGTQYEILACGRAEATRRSERVGDGSHHRGSGGSGSEGAGGAGGAGGGSTGASGSSGGSSSSGGGRDSHGLALSEAQAKRRQRQDLNPAAIWENGKWLYSAWCELRF